MSCSSGPLALEDGAIGFFFEFEGVFDVGSFFGAGLFVGDTERAMGR